MKNIYLFISLLCIISLNCFFYKYITEQREGFKMDDLNPVTLVDKGLGKIIDSVLGGVPILKDISKKVKKEKGLVDKIMTTFYELFISLLNVIFIPIAALITLFLGHQLFVFMLSNIPLLFKPTSILAGI